ncbi:unnamed protein product, partial [Choristocarpus tenellus]
TPHGYADASYASDPASYRSTSGYIFMLKGGSVTWSSKKQSMVSLSTTESESHALSFAAQEAHHLRSLLSSLGFDAKTPLILHEDNQGTMHLANNLAYSPRTKHFGVRLAFLRETVASGIVRVVHICTKEQLAAFGPRTCN